MRISDWSSDVCSSDLADVTGTVSFGKDTKGKQRLVITDLDGVSHETLIPKEKQVLVHDGQVVNKGEMIVDGPPDPHDILRLQGIRSEERSVGKACVSTGSTRWWPAH